MVKIHLDSFRGNHARLYPFIGHLGLDEVIVQGNFRAELEEDGRPIQATSVIVRVRCYEAESTGPNIKRKNMRTIYEREADRPVWIKAEGEQYGDLGNALLPFRITIPTEMDGVSTTTFTNYRTWWQVEAVVHHKYSPIHGSRLVVTRQLALARHALQSSPLPPLAWSSSLPAAYPSPSTSTSPLVLPTPYSQGIHYDVAALPAPTFGPGGEIEFSLRLRRDHPSLVVKSIRLELYRKVTFDRSRAARDDIDGSDEEGEVYILEGDELWSAASAEAALRGGSEILAGTPALSSAQASGRPTSRGLSSVFKRDRSVGASSSRSPLPSPSCTSTADPTSYFAPLPTPAASANGSNRSTPTSVGSEGTSRTVEESVLQADTSNVVLDGETRVVMRMPRDRSTFRYSMGETMRTGLVDVRFKVGVKILVSQRKGHTEIIELEPKPLLVIGADQEQRNQAVAGQEKMSSATVADAEIRLCDVTGTGRALMSPRHSVSAAHRPTPPSSTSLGARRASNFTLTVDTHQTSTAAPPLPSPTATGSQGRRNSWFGEPRSAGVRRRSEQSDVPLGAPVRSRARFGGSPSPPSAAPMALPSSAQGDVAVPSAGSGYVSSALSRPPLLSHVYPGTPTSPDFLVTPTPSTFAAAIAHADSQQQRSGSFPLAAPPAHYPSHASPDLMHSRHPRRAGAPSRSGPRENHYPYSSANRPRSAGALSVISQRSTLSEGSSLRSFTSGGSSASFVRETSAPLPSTSHSTLMLLLGDEDLPSLSLEPTKGREQRHHSPAGDEFVSGVVPVPHPSSPPDSTTSAASPPLASLPFGADMSHSPPLTVADDDDVSISSATSTPPLGSLDSPPSPAVDFHAFSLSRRQPATASASSPFAFSPSSHSPHQAPSSMDPATRAEIAPWSVAEEVGPFDVSERKGNGVGVSSKRPSPSGGIHSTWNSSAWRIPPSASSGMARTSSSSKLGAGEYLGVGVGGGGASVPRRKSSGGFGLFSGKNGDASHAQDEGNESPGKEGSRWGFLRRGSRA